MQWFLKRYYTLSGMMILLRRDTSRRREPDDRL